MFFQPIYENVDSNGNPLEEPTMTKDYNSDTTDTKIVSKLKKANVYLTVALNLLIVIYYVMDYRIQKLNNTIDHSMYHTNFFYSWLDNFYNFFTKMFCCLNYYDCSHSCFSGCRRKPGKYCASWCCIFCLPKKHEIWYFASFLVPLFLELTVLNGVFLVPYIPSFLTSMEGIVLED